MSLRLRISRLLLALFLGGSILLGFLTLDAMRAAIHEEMDAGSKVAVRILGAWLARGGDDIGALRSFLSSLGRVRANEIRLLDGGREIYLSPPPSYKAGREAPAWFAGLVAPELHTAMLQAGTATVEIRSDASRAVLDAWDDLLRFTLPPLVLMAAALALVFWHIGRDLAPVARIEQALRQVEHGQRNLHLPRFGVQELDRLGSGFNRMVERLAHSERENRNLEREIYADGVARAELERARREWARELHDELGQNLTAIASLARAIANRSGEGAVADAAGLIQGSATRVHEDLRRMLARMRSEEAGVEAALARLAEHWRACHPHTGCELACDGEFGDLEEPLRVALFRVAQEALTNAARHARAATVRVGLRRDAEGVRLEVADDGVGFDPARRGADGFGLKGMKERLAECGGRLEVFSHPGRGTRILAAVPT